MYYQLWPNTVIAECMALHTGDGAVARHAHLTRDGAELDRSGPFRPLLRPGFEGRFRHLSWEQLYREVVAGRPELATLRWYLEAMRAGLRKVFRLEPAC